MCTRNYPPVIDFYSVTFGSDGSIGSEFQGRPGEHCVVKIALFGGDNYVRAVVNTDQGVNLDQRATFHQQPLISVRLVDYGIDREVELDQ